MKWIAAIGISVFFLVLLFGLFQYQAHNRKWGLELILWAVGVVLLVGLGLRFRSMPLPLWLGGGLLSLGILAGGLMPHDSKADHHMIVGHLIAALVVWTGYAVLLAVHTVRGLTGRRLALLTVAWFILSLGVFAFI